MPDRAQPSVVTDGEVAPRRASISMSWPPETLAWRTATHEIDLTEPYLVDSVDAAVLVDSPDVAVETQPDRLATSTVDFAGIYVRSRARLERRARRFLSDPRDIEEVVQETFLRLVLAMPELDHEWQAQAFCNRVLTNLCIDRYRRDCRRPRMFELDSCAAQDIAGGDFADHEVLRAEDAAIVREGLALLSPLHRDALVKREIEEKSLPTIAAELGIAEASVKHLLFRARRSLRRLLAGSPVDPEIEPTAGEVEALAEPCPGRAVLRSANGLIALVAVLTVAAGTQGLPPQRHTVGNRREARSSGALRDRRLVRHGDLTHRAVITRQAS